LQNKLLSSNLNTQKNLKKPSDYPGVFQLQEIEEKVKALWYNMDKLLEQKFRVLLRNFRVHYGRKR